MNRLQAVRLYVESTKRTSVSLYSTSPGERSQSGIAYGFSSFFSRVHLGFGGRDQRLGKRVHKR